MRIWTKRYIGLLCLAFYGLIGASLISNPAKADPFKQYQTNQRGDFLLVGNTVGYDCRSGIPAPVVGAVGPCGANTNDTSVDVLWKPNSPSAGQAVTNNTITPDQAGSIAMLNLPVGTQVSYARLYWAAARKSTDSIANTTASFSRPGGFSQNVMAQTTNVINNATSTPGKVYQASAEVTDLIRANGSGAYQVTGVPAINPIDQNVEVNFVAWTLVVFYESSTGPTRNLTLFEGLDEVRANHPATVTLNGFLVPNAGFDAKLGIVAYEGDNSISGDKMLFKAGHDNVFHELSDGSAVGQTDNFFNATRMWLGIPVSVVGDLPRMSGGAGSMNGFDMDVVDIKPFLVSGDSSATISATSTMDVYYLGMFVTSISTFDPVVKNVIKSYENLSGAHDLVRRGNEVEYTIAGIRNTGSDDAIHAILEDTLPAKVTYIPGSLCVVTGLNGSVCEALTDVSGDDVGEYDAATNKIRVYLGEGATATAGGTLKPDAAPISIKFKVRVQETAEGLVSNQGIIRFDGKKSFELGFSGKIAKTGNGITIESPTVFQVYVCGDDFNDCPDDVAICDASSNPPRCTSHCRQDADCANLPGGKWVCRSKPTPDNLESSATQVCEPRSDLVLTVDTSTVSRDNEVVYTLHVENAGDYVVPSAKLVYDVPSGAQILGIDAGADWNCVEQNEQVVCTATHQIEVRNVASVIIRVLGPKNTASMLFHAGVESIGMEDYNLANNQVSFVTPLWTYGLSGGGLGGCAVSSPGATSAGERVIWILLLGVCVGLLGWKTTSLKGRTIRGGC